MRAVEATLLATLLGGCAEPASGFAWQVDLAGRDDACTDSAEQYSEQLRYVLQFDGAAVDVAVDTADGPVTFASGTIADCDIEYASVIFEEIRDDARIRWRLEGEALWRTGGLGCNLEQGVDWLGTETFTVVGSEHPDIGAGCQATVETEGVYLGELSEL